jgi:two-component system sensor histidine kinase HydH
LATEGYGESDGDGDGDGAREALESFAGHVRAMPEIMRANVYGADGHILWSTDDALIGRRFENNPELEEAMAGRLVREIGQLETDSKPEHVALGASASGFFIEAYLPIRSNGAVLGVVEIYKVPVALEAAINRGCRIIEISAAIGAPVLFATLYWIVRRGALQIRRQQAEIGRMEGLAAVGQMASAVAHSLRNPLSGIRSSAELLGLEYPAARPVSNEIIGEVDRLDQCVRELMDYARSDTVSVQRIEPLDLVRETVERQRTALERARVAVTIADERRAHRPVDVDPPMLGQAIASIVTNAIEAQPDGGSLRIVLSDPDNRHTQISSPTAAWAFRQACCHASPSRSSPPRSMASGWGSRWRGASSSGSTVRSIS